MARKKISDQKKQEAVNRFANGESSASICKDYGVTRQTILLWAKKIKAKEVTQESGDYRKELRLALQENERLKKYILRLVLKNIDSEVA